MLIIVGEILVDLLLGKNIC